MSGRDRGEKSELRSLSARVAKCGRSHVLIAAAAAVDLLPQSPSSISSSIIIVCTSLPFLIFS